MNAREPPVNLEGMKREANEARKKERKRIATMNMEHGRDQTSTFVRVVDSPTSIEFDKPCEGGKVVFPSEAENNTGTEQPKECVYV